jgi:translation initiation factor 5A
MDVKFVKAGQLREGGYVLVDGFVCQIKNIEKSKPGKHGSAKIRATAIGLFDNQKRTLLQPSTGDTQVPIVEKGNAQIVAVMGGQIQIMDVASYATYNVQKPGDIKDLKSGDEVEYLKAEENIKIVRKRSSA